MLATHGKVDPEVVEVAKQMSRKQLEAWALMNYEAANKCLKELDVGNQKEVVIPENLILRAKYLWDSKENLKVYSQGHVFNKKCVVPVSLGSGMYAGFISVCLADFGGKAHGESQMMG